MVVVAAKLSALQFPDRLAILHLNAPRGERAQQQTRNLALVGTLTFPECHRVAAWVKNLLTGKDRLLRVYLDGVDEQTRVQLISLLGNDEAVWPVPSPKDGRLTFYAEDPQLPKSARAKRRSTQITFEGRVHHLRLNGKTRKIMREVIERDGHLCVWCSKELSVEHPWASLDHIIPASRHGADEVANFCLSCRICNEKRQHRSAIDFMTICRARGQQVQEDLIWQRLEVQLLG